MSIQSGSAAERRTTFRDVLRVPEFRALWLAQVQSLTGDQLARVALLVLVFGRTGSAALTALVYALTFVPAVVGGAALGGLADRRSRRRVMVVCDLVRALCVATMAVPAVPLWLTCALLVAVVFVGQPFLAAETALLPDILSGDEYVVGSALRMLTGQAAQLVGFAGGGVAVALLGARVSLAVDAATFVVSALVISRCVRDRGAPWSAQSRTSGATRHVLEAARLVWRDRRLRVLAGLGWLAALHVVPEALAAPYAAALGGGPRTVGLLMAAPPAGTALGAYLILRVAPQTRIRLLGPLAVLTAVPMLVCALHPDLGASLALWGLLGVLAAYQVQAAASFVQLVPTGRRGQVIGLVSSGMTAAQGLGVLVFGLVGEHLSAASTIAVAGLVALACASLLAAAGASLRLWAHGDGSPVVADGSSEGLPPLPAA